MCKILENMRNESLEQGIKQGMQETALRMLAAGNYALDEIASVSGLSLEEVDRLKTDKNA